MFQVINKASRRKQFHRHDEDDLSKATEPVKMPALRCSIVIPTRDRSALLEVCLKALGNQTLRPDEFEIIVVDDGSTDRTSERALSLGKSMLCSLRVIRGSGHGPASARNLGWQAAEAPLVLFTDDDCVPSPSWAHGLVEFLETNPAFAGAGGPISRLKDSLTARFTDDIGCMEHPGDPYDLYYLVSANASYRRSVLKEVTGFNELFPCAGGEDPDLSIRVRKLGLKLGRAANSLVLHNHPNTVVDVYRMHYRYGRGEHGLLQSGSVNHNDRGTIRRLRREIERCLAIYYKRSDLSIVDRLMFSLLGCVRCYALYSGFRYQERCSFQE